MTLEDSYKHRGLRKGLVKIITEKGIKDPGVLAAVGKVPRHFFFDKAFLEHAYQDKAFPIGEGQTISQPYTVAFQTEKLEINPKDKVLEIGTGSGYQACILLEMGVQLYTIEYNEVLYQRVKKFLPSMGYKPHFFLGDGSRGIPHKAPFDKILVTAGAPSVPKALIEQLNTGGKLIIPVGDKNTQQMLLLEKLPDNKIRKTRFDYFSFVPLLGEQGWRG